MIKPMATGFTLTPTELNTKDTGRMICSTDTEKKSGLMAPATKAITLKGRNMVKDFTCGRMVALTTANGWIIESKGMAGTCG